MLFKDVHKYQTLWCSTVGNIIGRESEIGECHAIAYAFLRSWYKYVARKFPRFVSFTLRVINVYQNPTGTNTKTSKYDMCGSRGGTGGPDPPGKLQKI